MSENNRPEHPVNVIQLPADAYERMFSGQLRTEDDVRVLKRDVNDLKNDVHSLKHEGRARAKDLGEINTAVKTLLADLNERKAAEAARTERRRRFWRKLPAMLAAALGLGSAFVIFLKDILELASNFRSPPS